ncbi:MAG TPA: response regulator [Bryobacteraceae bacterium]|jgi:CheY-like chemotaxis protein/GGDEF domain-containing protein|nr:response regulator [Bryobacteraceae bacterium]
MPDRILVVDDDVDISANIRELLEGEGYVVSVAGESRQAVETAERENPDLILMDIHLGSGADGIETAGKIYERLRRSVIYLTGSDDDACLERAQQTGPFSYLLKPFQARQLLSAVKMGLHQQRARTESARNDQRKDRALALMSDAVFWIDPSGAVKRFSADAAGLLIVDPAQALGRSLEEICNFSDASEQPIGRSLVGKVFTLEDSQCVSVSGTARRRDGVEIPAVFRVIAYSGSKVEKEAILAVRLGSADSVMDSSKPAAEAQLSARPAVDPLTGLAGKPDASKLITGLLEAGKAVCAMILVVDNHTRLDSRYGRQVADEIISRYSVHLARGLPPDAVLFRWGNGPCFVVVSSDPDAKTLRQAHTRLLGMTRHPSPYYLQRDYRSALIPMTATWATFYTKPPEPALELFEKIDCFIAAQMQHNTTS